MSIDNVFAKYKHCIQTHVELAGMHHLFYMCWIFFITQCHLIDDGVVISSRFVVHAPTSIDKLQLLVSHQLTYLYA